MHCINSGSMELLWNGAATKEFTPSRGIQQGDPLSPYIFILCMEHISQYTDQLVRHGDWWPITLNVGGLQLLHLFFADDLILFSDVSSSQVHFNKRVFDEFCQSSSHKISMSKTRIFFSHKVADGEVSRISSAFRFQVSNKLGTYMGVPLLHGRVIKEAYRYILDNVRRRLSR